MWIDVMNDTRGAALQSIWKGTSACLWMESPAEISFSSLKALIAPQQHFVHAWRKSKWGVRDEEGQDTKGSLYFLAGCFGQFGFLLLHFTTVSLNPDRVFRALPKGYFYNTAVARFSGAKGNSCWLCFYLSLPTSPALHWEDSLGNHFSLGLPPAFFPLNSS